MSTFRIGCHLSISDGYKGLFDQAMEVQANTFACFLRNPRGGVAKAIQPSDLAAYLTLTEAHDIHPMVAHAPYTLNPAAAEERVLEFAGSTLAEDLLRMESTPHNLYNLHPGCHVGQGVAVGIVKVAAIIDQAIPDGCTTRVLLETMSGKGSELGGTFSEIQEIRTQCRHTERVGVCLDTCHVWDAGYDIVHDLDTVVTHFDQTVGLSNLYAIHLNDSKNDRGTRKDRHAPLGEGFLGWDAIARIINHPALAHLPFVLETPQELPGWALEIQQLKERRT